MSRNGSWRLVSVLMIAAMMAALLGGCAKSAETSANVMIVASNQEPVINWDPSYGSSNEVVVINNVYETLTRYDFRTQKVLPLLATSWTKSADATEWTFSLRKDVKFHNGDAMDANAVKFSLDRTIQLGKGASYIWTPIKEILVVDQYTVKIIAKFPTPVDILCSAAYAAHVMNPKTANHDWYEAGNADGTGPYMVESWTRGDQVVLTKNPSYWGGWRTDQVEKAVIKLVADASTRRRMVERGQAHWVYNLPFEDIEALKKNPKLTVVSTPSQLNMVAYMNVQKAPLSNKLIRQAVSYAFPYQDVVDTVYAGYAEPSRGIIPDGMWAHSDNVRQYTTDLEKAKQLIAEAGYGPGSGKKLAFNLVYTAGDEAERKTAELLKSQLALIGVELDVRGVLWDTAWTNAKSPNPAERQDMFLMYWWPDVPMPSGVRALFYTEKDPLFNLGYYSNPVYDKLVDEAESLAGIDLEQAKAKYTEAQNIVVDNAVALFICDIVNVRVLDGRFKGYTDNPFYPNVVFFYDLTVDGRK